MDVIRWWIRSSSHVRTKWNFTVRNTSTWWKVLRFINTTIENKKLHVYMKYDRVVYLRQILKFIYFLHYNRQKEYKYWYNLKFYYLPQHLVFRMPSQCSTQLRSTLEYLQRIIHYKRLVRYFGRSFKRSFINYESEIYGTLIYSLYLVRELFFWFDIGKLCKFVCIREFRVLTKLLFIYLFVYASQNLPTRKMFNFLKWSWSLCKQKQNPTETSFIFGFYSFFPFKW